MMELVIGLVIGWLSVFLELNDAVRFFFLFILLLFLLIKELNILPDFVEEHFHFCFAGSYEIIAVAPVEIIECHVGVITEYFKEVIVVVFHIFFSIMGASAVELRYMRVNIGTVFDDSLNESPTVLQILNNGKLVTCMRIVISTTQIDTAN